MEQTRILSVQSHVVSGHCGNTAAVFPLQLLGFEVDVINSVQFSNHTQYKVSRGNIFNKRDFDLLYEGLTTNNLTEYYTNILSGYIADLSFIESLVKAVEEIKKKRTSLGLPCTYTFDPVLGDDGTGFYVPNPEGVADAYKKLMTQANIMLPNRFEASYLSGIEVKDIPSAMSAIDVFHGFGVEVVVITSVQLDSSLDVLTCLASYKKKNCQTDVNSSSIERYRIDVPKLDKPFTGTGDLFAALFTAWIQKTGSNIKLSLEKSISTIAKILKDTHEWSNKNQSKLGAPMAYELRIVQNKCTIEDAIVEYSAEPI